MPAGEWPHIFSAIHALGFEFSQSENRSRRQALHSPQAMGKGTTTRSPTFRFLTPRPTSITSPMNSWPRTSPFSIVGTKPLKRWRSDPQIAVEETRTIASRAFRIRGSGTSSIRTFFFSIQQLAFIGRSSALHRFRRRLRGMRPPVDARVGPDHLADFHHLLEPPQVLADLEAGLLAEQPGDDGADLPRRRVVGQAHAHLGAPAARRVQETHGPGVRHVRP